YLPSKISTADRPVATRASRRASVFAPEAESVNCHWGRPNCSVSKRQTSIASAVGSRKWLPSPAWRAIAATIGAEAKPAAIDWSATLKSRYSFPSRSQNRDPAPRTATTGGWRCSAAIHAIGTPSGIRVRAWTSHSAERGVLLANAADSRLLISLARATMAGSATGPDPAPEARPEALPLAPGRDAPGRWAREGAASTPAKPVAVAAGRPAATVRPAAVRTAPATGLMADAAAPSPTVAAVRRPRVGLHQPARPALGERLDALSRSSARLGASDGSGVLLRLRSGGKGIRGPRDEQAGPAHC